MVIHHLPGQPIPVLDHSLREEVFLNTQTKSFLVQLESIPSSSIASYEGEKADPHLTTTSLQVAVESNKVIPEPPLLQAEQTPFPQPLLIRPVRRSHKTS